MSNPYERFSSVVLTAYESALAVELVCPKCLGELAESWTTVADHAKRTVTTMTVGTCLPCHRQYILRKREAL